MKDIEDVKLKADILKFSISDSQDIIRFIETKTAICITILTAHLVGIYAILDKLIKHSEIYDHYFWTDLIVVLVFHALIIYSVFSIVLPRINPKKHILHNPKSLSGVNLFILNKKSKLFTKIFTSKNKLDDSFENYYHVLINEEPEGLLKSLTFELLKVNYVRNIKSDRLKILAYLTLVASGFFITFIVLYYYQTPLNILQNGK